MENSIKKFFSLDDLKRLKNIERKKITTVTYFVWINKIAENNPYVFIDKLKLEFNDGNEIILSAGEESDHLYFDDNFDFMSESENLKNEFEGKIILKEHSASNDKFWIDIIGKEIMNVQLSKDGDYYLADALIFDFGDEKRLIAISPEEGLIIDFHEEI